MNIKATEQSRQGSSVLVLFELGTTRYDRYISAETWDADSEAVIADVYTHLTNIPVPEPVVVSKVASIIMTDDSVSDKLIAVAMAKAAVEAAKLEATKLEEQKGEPLGEEIIFSSEPGIEVE